MYYLLLVLLYPASLLPLWMLYRVSDVAYLVLYYLMGYRKAVVRDNLTQAFPEKPAQEIHAIMKRFYRSFCDQWIETLKLLSLSRRALNRRITGNWEVLDELAVAGKDAYILSGHTYNWEWATAAVGLHVSQDFFCVYQPLSSPGFDALMLRIRQRAGTVMISLKGLKSGFKKMLGKQYIMGLAADQNPSGVETAEWISFMHREAPFFRGPELMPRRARAAVVLISLQKVRRGYYSATLRKITDDASQEPEGAILRSYVRFLEEQLRRQPENYLWSHRRWKHRRAQ